MLFAVLRDPYEVGSVQAVVILRSLGFTTLMEQIR